MSESKSEITQRLRCEGRWEAASEFLEEQRAERRSQGMSRQEANQAAWAAVRERFPRLDAGPPQDCDGTGPADEFADLDEAGLRALVERSQESDIEADRKWTYTNLANLLVKPSEAPSLGAWAMLKWARAHQARFFESLLPRRSLRHAEVEDQPTPTPPDDARLPEGNAERLTRSLLERVTAGLVERPVEEVAACPCCATRLLLRNSKGRTAVTICPADYGETRRPDADWTADLG